MEVLTVFLFILPESAVYLSHFSRMVESKEVQEYNKWVGVFFYMAAIYIGWY